MARQRHTIRNMPLRGGLVTAGQHGTIPEDQLWRAENCSAGLDGLMVKRPGLWQWGQTIRQPRRFNAVSFYEMFDNIDSWTDDDGSANITWFTSNNKLILSVTNDTAGASTSVLGRVATGTQVDSSGDDWSVRFTATASNMLATEGFIVSCRSKTGNSPYAFKFLGDRIQYYATGGTWTDYYLHDFYEAAAKAYEIRFDANGNVTIFINDTEVGTAIAVSAMDPHTAFSVGAYIELSATSGAVDVTGHSITISDLMFEGAVVRQVDEDGDPLTDDVPYEPFVASRLAAGTDFKSLIGGNAVRRNLLVASDKYLYRDASMNKFWSPLMKLSGGSITMAPYGDDLIICDGNSSFGGKLYRWDGRKAPELLEDAPNVRFVTEHKTRLFAAGDKKFPLRLYFTASRDPKVWFAPEVDADGQETVDEVLNAGYVQVPGKRGDEVVAIYGEFYGSCVVCTNRGIWRLTGSSPLSYQLENVTQDTGASSFAGLTRMGNDLWIAGRQGVTTIQTVDQFGDMKGAMPSAPIADLWAPGISNSSIKVDQYQLYRNSLSWNPTLSLMYFAFARQGATDVSSIMAYNPVTQGWYGPWTGDTTFVADVEIASPIVQATMHGTSTGKVGITDPNYKADFGESFKMTFESPYLNGRSIDPSITHQKKTWKSLRLFVQLRGAWDLDIKWQTDDETYQTRVESQNMFNLPILGQDWRLNVDPDGRIHSNQLIGVIEIPLEAVGRYLKFEVSTADDYVGEDLAIQGYEIEFEADGPDQEQE